MSSKDVTTSVKLGWETRSKLRFLAKMRCRSVHSLIKEAVARLVEREMAVQWAYHPKDGKPLPEIFRAPAAETDLGSKAGLPHYLMIQIKNGNNRLRVLRGWRGMSLEKLSAALAALNVHVDEKTLDEIEDDRRRPGSGLFAVLAKVLDVDLDDLLG